MREILPNVFHWTVIHPKIKVEVSSYYLVVEKVLIDPLEPREGLDEFTTKPEHILLTNRHHYRHSGKFVERFGCAVWCVETGLHEFQQGEEIRPFRFGDLLPGNITAVEIGAICPDETALHIPRADGLVALGDGAIRQGDSPLQFVPDQYIGDDPDGVKAKIRDSYRRLLERDFNHLLLAHGWPWVGSGKQALRDFAGG
jgi:hypothetical protein